jgi:hypothetical protein
MAEWQNGRMAEWQNGRMAEWQYGRMAEWRIGGMGMMKCRMAEWRDGVMAEWRGGGMAEWRNGGMVFYYIPNLSCYICGTRQRRQQRQRHQWLLNHLDVLNGEHHLKEQSKIFSVVYGLSK